MHNLNVMATPKRFFPAETYYHVYNRGNRKADIFVNENDYRRFLQKLKKYKQTLDIEIIAYCLMPNHFHLLIKQNKEHNLQLFMLRLCTSYAKYFNTKYEHVGRLFQDRFRSKMIENETYLIWLSKYIHLNPLDVLPAYTPLKRYKWSSYPEYLFGDQTTAQPDIVLSYFPKTKTTLKYKEFVEAGLSERETINIEPLALDL